MVNEEKLSVVLSEFARTVITDFPIQAILDHLVTKIVDLMPVSGAGVSLIGADNKPRYIAASDASALLFEHVQSELGEGPCLAAYASAEAVSVPDLAADERFPRFAPAALDAGLAAVFTFPLGRGAASLGALDLYKNSPGRSISRTWRQPRLSPMSRRRTCSMPKPGMRRQRPRMRSCTTRCTIH